MLLQSILIVFGCALMLFGVIVGCLWFHQSYSTFPRRLSAGEKYTVAEHEMNVPDLPHKIYKSYERPSKENPVLGLDKSVLDNLYTLLRDVMQCLRSMNADFYVTGGTLIGAVLWKGLMVYDDDLDLTVFWSDRELLWSQAMVNAMSKYGLEVFYMRGQSLTYADRTGSAVRIRRKGSIFPTCDIFVTKETPTGFAKVDSWFNDRITLNRKERWESEWVLPLRQVEMLGLVWTLPNMPEKLLTAQYGEEWMHTIQSPHPLIASHRFGYQLSNVFGAWTVGTPDKENPHVGLLHNGNV